MLSLADDVGLFRGGNSNQSFSCQTSLSRQPGGLQPVGLGGIQTVGSGGLQSSSQELGYESDIGDVSD